LRHQGKAGTLVQTWGEKPIVRIKNKRWLRSEASDEEGKKEKKERKEKTTGRNSR